METARFASRSHGILVAAASRFATARGFADRGAAVAATLLAATAEEVVAALLAASRSATARGFATARGLSSASGFARGFASRGAAAVATLLAATAEEVAATTLLATRRSGTAARLASARRFGSATARGLSSAAARGLAAAAATVTVVTKSQGIRGAGNQEQRGRDERQSNSQFHGRLQREENKIQLNTDPTRTARCASSIRLHFKAIQIRLRGLTLEL